MFYDSAEPFPREKESLGRWMGISHRVGQGMCYWILKRNGEVVARSTVRPLTLEENTSNLLRLDEDDDDSTLSSYEEPDALMPDGDYEDYDKYLSAEVILSSKGNQLLGKVIKRKRDHTGTPIGTSNKSPLLDTRVYDVQLR